MSLRDDTPPDGDHGPLDLLRHDLKAPLTTIHGRAQLLTRGIRRSPTLADEERARLLLGLAAIEAAVREMVTRIDGIGADAPDGRADAEWASGPIDPTAGVEVLVPGRRMVERRRDHVAVMHPPPLRDCGRLLK